MSPKERFFADVASRRAIDAKIARVQLHKVVLNTDTTEGRGRTYYEWFVDGTLARQRAKGAGGMGTDAPVEGSMEDIVIVGE